MMLLMHRVIISDTSCLIILSKVNELELLHKVYQEIVTTAEIQNEFGEKLPNWVKILEVKNKNLQEVLELSIDKGESSAIALAIETPNSVVILDDLKARKVATKLKLTFTGTIGVIIKAKLEGHIQSIKPILKKLKETDFRLSLELETSALIAANEILS